MATLKLNLSRLNPPQLIALGNTVSGLLAPAAPATPPIAGVATEVANMNTAKAAAQAANQKYEDAKAALVGLKELRDSTADALRVEHTALGSVLEAKCKGVASELAKSGYPLSATPVQSTQPPGQVLNLSITAGDADGVLDGHNDPTDGVKTYEVQMATVDPVAGPWTTKLQPTTSTWKLENLTSGQRVWVRVRAVGVNGQGPWSDPATKIVP